MDSASQVIIGLRLPRSGFRLRQGYDEMSWRTSRRDLFILATEYAEKELATNYTNYHKVFLVGLVYCKSQFPATKRNLNLTAINSFMYSIFIFKFWQITSAFSRAVYRVTEQRFVGLLCEIMACL